MLYVWYFSPYRKWRGVLAHWSGGTVWLLWPAPSQTSRNLVSMTWMRLPSRSYLHLSPHWHCAAPHTSLSPSPDRYDSHKHKHFKHKNFMCNIYIRTVKIQPILVSQVHNQIIWTRVTRSWHLTSDYTIFILNLAWGLYFCRQFSFYEKNPLNNRFGTSNETKDKTQNKQNISFICFLSDSFFIDCMYVCSLVSRPLFLRCRLFLCTLQHWLGKVCL